MAENTEHHDDHGHGTGHYFKIYVTLLVLFIISVIGPEVGEFTGLRWITLVTAFGIAIWKARLVINEFMHLNVEKRIMKWLLTTSLILMALMVAGVAPDVLNHEGQNWENLAAQDAVARGLAYMEGEAYDEGEGTEVVEAAPVGFAAATSYGQVCASCHGAAGAGDGVAGAALDPAPANFTDAAFWEGRDRERIITVIRDGAVAVGGSALMAPWGALYTEEQLGQMADYVMSFNPNQ